MTIEQLATIVTAGKEKMTELELVQKIMTITKLPYQRCVSGYKIMRGKGLINHKVHRYTIGTIDKLEQNEKISMIVNALDMEPTKIAVNGPISLCKKPSEYQPDEIIPDIKMTPREIHQWIASPPKYFNFD